MPSENAPVAQLDRAPDYESGGQEFESLRARQQFQADTLDGGLGADTMVGGTENDVYIVDDTGDVVSLVA